jgi:hypothetical protein
MWITGRRARRAKKPWQHRGLFRGAYFIMRIVMTLVAPAVAILTNLLSASAQSPANQLVALEALSAARALDAIPAVFAVAQNLGGVEIDISANSMASGFSDLADETAAQDQLTAALGAYGFEGYGVWAATIRTIFATYGFIRSEGQAAPIVDRALQKVLNDPGVPQNQKDAIVRHMDDPKADMPKPDGAAPTDENLVVVIELVPHIESTIEMMGAMQ